MAGSDINFSDAFRLLSRDGGGVFNAQDAAREEEFLNEHGGAQFTESDLERELQRLKQSSQNTEKLARLLSEVNKTDSVSKSTLYHIFKSSNRISQAQFDEFLDHLNVNADRVDAKQLVLSLSSMY